MKKNSAGRRRFYVLFIIFYSI